MLANLPTWLVILAPKILTAGFVFAFGACVGSFLNVVAHRLPAGRSVVSPPSRCPRCGWRLSWHENLPIIGWLLLRGRCRRCRSSISLQYPVIELVVAIIFAGTYLLFYAVPEDSILAPIAPRWWSLGGLGQTWPAFAILMTMISGLVVATLIDARTFLIPAQITNLMLIVAFLGWCLQGAIPPLPSMELVLLDGRGPMPRVGIGGIGLVAGALIGNAIALALLWKGVIPRSFDDYEDYVTDDSTLAEYPHGRREMVKEIVFLLPILIGGLIGWLLVDALGTSAPASPGSIDFLASSGLGFLVGGGLVWGIRILGIVAAP